MTAPLSLNVFDGRDRVLLGARRTLRIELPWCDESKAFEEFDAAPLMSPRRAAMERRWNRIRDWKQGDTPLQQQQPETYEVERGEASELERAIARSQLRPHPGVTPYSITTGGKRG